jgi:succinate-semialdehyde dehydrogenase / glutarate-semialdehyde dehydrogenase
MIQSLNPANGQVLRRFEPLTPAALETKLALAASAAKTYPTESLEQRRFWMRRLALLLESDREELAALMTAEMGKPIVVARAEVDKCASACRYYAENAARILEAEVIATEHTESYVRWDPLGVILAIMPWNFPLWQVFRFVAPALMAGNVGLLKHAPQVPQCALAIEALVRRAGFPRGSFQALLMEAKDVEQVLGDDRVAAVTLTGSEAAGRAVAAQAGYLIKKSVLELGGSDPFLVLPSANIAAAVANGVKSRAINSGQSCIAAKRFVVHEAVYAEFERAFVEGMEALKVGDPTLEETEVGPMVSAEALQRLLDQVEAALTAGGRVLTGGNRIEGDGFYLEPTVIAGVPRTAPICAEEFFGPIALLFKVGSLAEAIEVANDTPFGLGASCWTSDAEEQDRLARELEAGAVFFNTPVASDPRLPFGGIKRSGYGRELSAAGMREFLNAKTVVVAEPAEILDEEEIVRAAEPAQQPQPASEEIRTTEPASAPPENAEKPEPRSGSLLGLSR